MTRSKSQSDSVHSTGFSVLELLIVLGIIVAIAAMATPNLMSMVQENAVFNEADRLRETLGETRRFAVDTGIDYEFRYELNGPTGVVLPSEVELNETEEGQSTTTGQYHRALLQMPDGMRIRADEGIEERSETLDADRFGNLGGGELTKKQWSTAIIFRFDGQSDDFVFRVSDKAGLTSKVTLRGLTGTTRTSQVYPEEDQ